MAWKSQLNYNYVYVYRNNSTFVRLIKKTLLFEKKRKKDKNEEKCGS